jgi:hypothetical protein
MKNILSCLSLIILLIFCSCQNQDKKSPNKDNSVEFLALFNDINPSGLHIYPLNNKVDGQKFKGKPIDVKKYNQVNNEKIFTNINAAREGNSNIYAICKFEINDKLLGLLIRQWSQYEESSIELVLWDKDTKCIINSLPLADSFGDEGWYFDKESWITDFKNGQLTFLTRKKDYIPSENGGDSIVTDSVKTSKLNGIKFNTRIERNVNLTNFELLNWSKE